MLFRIFKWGVYSGSALLFLGGAGVFYVFYDLTASVPQLPTELDDIFGQPTRIYGDDADGNPVLLHTLGGNQRVPLNLRDSRLSMARGGKDGFSPSAGHSGGTAADSHCLPYSPGLHTRHLDRSMLL